jgi:phosphoserine phosphatase
MNPDKILLAAFDMDGTVLKHDSSWAAIHRRFGTESKGARSLKLYGEGKIGYREFMRRDIASWPKGLKRHEIEEILSGYEVREDAPATLQVLRERGIKTALVTSGIDILAEKVADELRMDYWVANGLRFDSSGQVLPEGVGRVDPRRKDLAYKKLLGRVRIPGNRTIAVGDTVYDLAFLKAARKGFMLAHTTRVPDKEIIHIDRLSEILEHI